MTREGWTGVCECGKRIFESRKAARRFSKARFPEHMSAYFCPLSDGWHIGHLSRQVIAGKTDRNRLREKRAQRWSA